MERIHVDEPVLVKTSHFTEKLEEKKKGLDGRGCSSLCHVIEENITVPLEKPVMIKKNERKTKKANENGGWFLIPEVLEGGRKTKQHHLDQKKKKEQNQKDSEIDIA